MQTIPLAGGPIAFEGAVSLEVTPAGVKPWRLPFEDIELFEPPLIARAEQPSGVRITFLSDTREVAVEVEPLADGAGEWAWDLVADGELCDRVRQASSGATIRFKPLPAGANGSLRRVEVFMPSHYLPVRVRALRIADGARAERWNDPRKRWVVYGSSITHAKEAAGPSETWSAVVARRFDLHRTNLGYGGQEHLEPMVARMIRDLPADCISLCVGGNVWGLASLTERTFRAAVIGLVKTIRDGHPRTPVALASFIHCPRSEGVNNLACADLARYRGWAADAVQALRRHGDDRLFYVHGPELFGPEFAPRMPDGVHPDAEGQRLLGQRYAERVMARMV